MARKESITRDAVLQSAFEMLKEEGAQQVTARKLAAKAGCSTQPIFRIFKNMEELMEVLFGMAIEYFEDYYESFPKVSVMPFVNLGLAYIQFAQQNKNLFKLLFLSENRYGNSLYNLINGQSGAVGREINVAKKGGSTNPSELFMKMWIFIHGAACMSLTGDYDLAKEETVKLLKDLYQAFR